MQNVARKHNGSTTIKDETTKNAGMKKVAQSKMQGWKRQEWNRRYKIVWVENKGVKNAEPDYTYNYM